LPTVSFCGLTCEDSGVEFEQSTLQRAPKRRLWTRRRDSETLSWMKLYNKGSK
jgi:hypothetical protein